MAGGLFPRLKTWIFGEDLSSEDLNDEFDNIISNLNPENLSGYEASVAQMKLQSNPGTPGSENLGVALSDDIEQIRYMLAAIIGSTLWYSTPNISLDSVATLLGGASSNPNRITSGAVDGFSQPMFLQAATAAKVKLLATVTPFFQYINGTAYDVSADTLSSALSLAGSSSASQATLAADLTKTSDQIIMSSAGANITALIGKFAAFKIDSEVIIGYVLSATQIVGCIRGATFDSSSVNIPAATHTSTTVFNLLNMIYIFVDNTGALVPVYKQPAYSYTAPTSPTTGDYWLDQSISSWKVFTNTSVWVLTNSNLVGLAFTDSANCIATRSGLFFKNYDNLCSVFPNTLNSTQIISSENGYEFSVNGNYFSALYSNLLWDASSTLDSGTTISSSSTYYLYVQNNGQPIISATAPYDFNYNMRGFYHPFRPWRCVGVVVTDGSGNFQGIVQGQGSFSPFHHTSGTILTATILSKGGPVMLALIPLPSDASGSPQTGLSVVQDGSATSCQFSIARDGIVVSQQNWSASPLPVGGGVAPNWGTLLPICVAAIDITCPPGQHTYVLTISGHNAQLNDMRLVPIELAVVK